MRVVKTLKIAGALIVAALVVILAYAATRPDAFRVERSLLIQAAPERIFPLVNDFHQWGKWSPYEKLDPAMQRKFGGADRGKGATYAWEGNDQAGKGRMEIIESQAASRIAIDLQFIEPFAARNLAEFSFRPEAGGTRVSWAMQGSNPYIAKVMQVFMDFDHMIGRDFEAGLAALKQIAEQ
ncbi:SRPBCC family protein [Uliginosibacterium sp. H1]|uniref:SRPBCC family protein n=1 Tax=Uliginosibacterium sp. H1 TaxID=3114757 RepID=UPI002E19E528|nr:SRPBCC family protein [Uliginosibacterium sp. H1]